MCNRRFKLWDHVKFELSDSKVSILTSTNQDFLRATLGDEITASYGKAITLRAVHKIVAGRGCDTVIIGQPAQGENSGPENKPAQEEQLP